MDIIDFNQPQIVLAPMEGLTDPLMRDILTSIGHYDWTVSEFIRVTPEHVQLLGSEPDLMAGNAIRAVELGALAIDINFGCPAKTVNSHRGGSVLLTEPETLYQIIHAVRQAVPSDTPV